MDDLIGRISLKQSIAVSAILEDKKTLEQIIDEEPSIDAVPRQKYEEDMESAFAHGYTDAESKYRKMIEDGELIEVVRCKDCKHKVTTEDGEYNPHDIVCDYWESDGLEETDFCSYGERKTDE